MEKTQRNSQLTRLVKYAIIAALYAAASLALAPISFGSVQFRISEALTLLPVIMPEAVIGVTLGCAITNFIGALMGVNILGFVDVFVGTFATFIAAILTRQLRHIRIGKIPFLAAVPPVLINAIFIGAQLAIALSGTWEFSLIWSLFWSMAISVGIGQILSCFVLGLPLIMQLETYFSRKQLGNKNV